MKVEKKGNPKKRENLYKKANLNKNLKQKARDEKLNARTQKKTLLDLVRRGIPKDLSDEEDSSDVLTPRTLRTKKKADQMNRLEEFKRQKEVKKTLAVSQSKKPAFYVGVYRGFDKFSDKKNPWKKTTLKPKEVFVFKGNKASQKMEAKELKNIPEESEAIIDEFKELAVQKTPLKKMDDNIVNVTPKLKILLDRGNHSDKRREKQGKTPSKTPAEILDLDEENNHDVDYFKRILQETSDKLTTECQKWEEEMAKLDANRERYEDICGNIRLTIGKANLLMNKKGRFEQFRGLIRNCEFNLGEKETTCMDLQGFWEMIHFQVEDCEAKFKELDELQAKNWVQEEQKVKTKAKKTGKPVGAGKPNLKVKASSNLRAILAEKRKAMQQASANPQIKVDDSVDAGKPAVENEERFDAGFFHVVASPKPSPKPDNLRKSALQIASGGNRLSMSRNSPKTPLAVIAATKSIRRSMQPLQLDFEETEKENRNLEPPLKPAPCKSPLKELLGPWPRRSVAVAMENLMFFDDSPSTTTPRRSTRLSSARKVNYKESELFKHCVQGGSPYFPKTSDK